MKKTKISDLFLGLSVLSVVFSAAVSILRVDLWLAGTQWMLIAIVIAVWGILLKK